MINVLLCMFSAWKYVIINMLKKNWLQLKLLASS